MFAMLVVAAVLIRFNVVHSKPLKEDKFDSGHVAKIFSEDDMTPDFAEQLGRYDHTRDMKKRNNVVEEQFGPPHNEVRTTTRRVIEKSVNYTTARNLSEPNALRSNPPVFNESGHDVLVGDDKRLILHDEIDIVDREDHVTQYLSDQMVNTDSEITSLQASEVEDDRADSVVEVKEDSFFAFLTGQEKPVDLNGGWSKPAIEDPTPRTEDREVNVVFDMEYKY